MIINGEFYDSYDDWCEETLKYMQCQKESFDFGKGEMSISSKGGEHATYKFSILHYLNSFHDDNDFYRWLKAQRKDEINRKIEARFDELSNEKLIYRLNNTYDNNIKYRKKRLDLVREIFTGRWYVPFYINRDEYENEYIKYVNINRSGDRKKKYRRISKSTRSYQHYCEYCEKEIVYDEETLCNSCYSNFEAEGIFVFERQKENEIMWNNDFSEYKVKDGHWQFHNYYFWEEKRWNILHMKLN